MSEKEEKKEERRTFGEWFGDLWYRYKWLLIICALLAVFLIISLAQIIGAKDADIKILYVGPEYLNEKARERLFESIASLAPDYDGDGEVNTDLLDIMIRRYYDESDPENYIRYDKDLESNKRFQTEIRAGDAVIYILDSVYYKKSVEEGILAKLTEVLPPEAMPAEVYGEYGVELGKIDARLLPGFDVLPGDLVLCIRRSPDKDNIKYGRAADYWESNRKAFENIIKYRA
ncbi:MAG: hypothetical protein J5925_02155 [Clostridia bacterium]|nr:hypothetical protein [Clostridia bacterium]MBR4799235.1 hypothetical protein [Clostridia bacterium]